VTTALARRDDDRASYGPCMLALASDRDRSFAMFFVIHGSAAESARRAGFGRENSTAETFAKIGYRKMQHPAMQAAVAEETRNWFRAAAPAAARTYHRVLEDPKAKDQDRLRAADAVMARVDPVTTAHTVQVQHEHRHKHELSASEVTARILELASRVGIDVAKLPPTIDAVAVEVPA